MGVPSGEVIGRPMVVRACGCEQEFQLYSVDRYREQRLAKFKSTRCPACVAKLQAPLPKKGEAFKMLPPGTQVTLTAQQSGAWAGVLTGGGEKVEKVEPELGPQSLVLALVRLWLARDAEKKGDGAKA
jgi:hypothetical protein